MRTRTRLSVFAGLAVVLTFVAAAVAGEDGRPETEQVEASIVFDHLEGKARECEGRDGFYSENRITLSGTAVGHPALSGSVEVKYEELVNITEGFGPQQGRIVIRDPVTHKTKARGQFDNVGPLDMTQGVIVGTARFGGEGDRSDNGDDDDNGTWTLIANWRITYRETGGIDAQIGGVAEDTRLPAGIHRGRCSGRFESFEFDLPTNGTAATTAAVTTTWRATRTDSSDRVGGCGIAAASYALRAMPNPDTAGAWHRTCRLWIARAGQAARWGS
jgi:hypothetical protein